MTSSFGDSYYASGYGLSSSYGSSSSNTNNTVIGITYMPSQTIIGRNIAGVGPAEILSPTTTKSILSLDQVENTRFSTWTGSTNVTSVGTVTSGSWNGNLISSNYGGTNNTGSSYTNDQVAIHDASNKITTSDAPSIKTLLSLNNVENTAVSSWTGTSNLSSVGNVMTGSWNTPSNLIQVAYGGTNNNAVNDKSVMYYDGTKLDTNSTKLVWDNFIQGLGINPPSSTLTCALQLHSNTQFAIQPEPPTVDGTFRYFPITQVRYDTSTGGDFRITGIISRQFQPDGANVMGKATIDISYSNRIFQYFDSYPTIANGFDYPRITGLCAGSLDDYTDILIYKDSTVPSSKFYRIYLKVGRYSLINLSFHRTNYYDDNNAPFLFTSTNYSTTSPDTLTRVLWYKLSTGVQASEMSGSIKIQVQDGVTRSDLSGNLTTQGAFSGSITRSSVSKPAANYSVSATDPDVIGVSALTTNADVTLSLPLPTICKGKQFIFMDESGNCNNNNRIVLSGRFNNSVSDTTYAISTQYGSVRIFSNGVTWLIQTS